MKRECQLFAAPQTWIALVDGMIKSIYWFLSIKDVPDTATIIIYFQWDWKLSDQVAVWLPTTSQIFGRKPNLPLDWLDWGNWRYFKFLLSNQRDSCLCSDPVLMYVTNPRVGIEWKIYPSCTTGGSHKVSKALFAICVLTILFNILLFAVILSKKELRHQVQKLSYLRE